MAAEYEHTNLCRRRSPHSVSKIERLRSSNFWWSSPSSLLASLLLPALAKAKEKGQRGILCKQQSATGLAMHMYADDHGIKWLFPSSLIRSVTDQDGSTCPFPEEASGAAERPIRPNHPIYQPEIWRTKAVCGGLNLKSPGVTGVQPTRPICVVETAEQQTFHVRHE